MTSNFWSVMQVSIPLQLQCIPLLVGVQGSIFAKLSNLHSPGFMFTLRRRLDLTALKINNKYQIGAPIRPPYSRKTLEMCYIYFYS